MPHLPNLKARPGQAAALLQVILSFWPAISANCIGGQMQPALLLQHTVVEALHLSVALPGSSKSF